MRIVVAAIFLLAVFPAWAQPCSMADAQAAENAVDQLDSWQAIHAAYRRYAHCDDGSIAEGFTDKVVHLLATRWGSLGQAQRIAAHDSGFQSFMLRHIDSTALTSELDRIAHSARHQCPRSATVLCKQIAGAAEAANSDAGPRE